MPNYFTELKDGPSGPSFKVKDEEAEQAIGAIGTALGKLTDAINGARLTDKLYTVNFTENRYVAPAFAIFDGNAITAEDVKEYGVPVSGMVLNAGYPVSSNAMFTKVSSGGYRIQATSYAAGNQDIYVQFLKL